MSEPVASAPDFLTTAHATIEQFEAIQAQVARSVGKPALVTIEYGTYYPYQSDFEGWTDAEYCRAIQGFQLGLIREPKIEAAENSWSIPTTGVISWQVRWHGESEANLGDMHVSASGHHERTGDDSSIEWSRGASTQEIEEDGSIVVKALEGAAPHDRFRVNAYVQAATEETPGIHDLGRTQLHVGIWAIQKVMSLQEKRDPILKKVLSGDLRAAQQ